MLLQAGGRTNGLRNLLAAEQQRGPDFFRLSQSLILPRGHEERRLLEAMPLAMPRWARRASPAIYHHAHAAFEMARRRVVSIVRGVLAAPEQRHPVRAGRDVLNPGLCLTANLSVRVCRCRPQPSRGCHVYRTSRIAKYWAAARKPPMIENGHAEHYSQTRRPRRKHEDKPGIILDYDEQETWSR
jgi:hypothetical protein